MDFLFRPLYIFRLMMLMIMQPPLDRHHPTNIISQWRGEWKSAPVVNSFLVDTPSHPLCGNQDSTYLDTTGHFRIVSGPTKATVHPVKRSGALQQSMCFCAYGKRCHILSTAAHGPSWRGGCSDCTHLMMLLPNGCRHLAHKCTRQQQH